MYGYTVIDPLSVVVTHLSEVIRQHAYELLTRQEVVHLVENTKKAAPELVDEAFPNLLSYGLFQRILTSLLKEGVPIKDLETIIETVIDTIQETGLPLKDLDSVTERIRVALKRTITRMYCEDGSMLLYGLKSRYYTEPDPADCGTAEKIQWFYTESGGVDFTGDESAFLSPG